ncbi:hypothetical protein [Streptomyces aureus]|uniref:hypothetical protein n=1 Tax=Streptomyces aureus TaxID=193461 RepID=UPI00367CF488
MRVKVLEDIAPYFNYGITPLSAGEEVAGDLAAYLASTRSPVEPLDGEARALFEGDAPAADNEPADGELDIEATAADVLDWVGDDPERASEALAAEQAKDKPRSTLVKQLEKLADSGE